MYLVTTTDDSGYEVFSQEYSTLKQAEDAARDTLIVTGYSAVIEDLNTGDPVWSATAGEE